VTISLSKLSSPGANFRAKCPSAGGEPSRAILSVLQNAHETKRQTSGEDFTLRCLHNAIKKLHRSRKYGTVKSVPETTIKPTAAKEMGSANWMENSTCSALKNADAVRQKPEKFYGVQPFFNKLWKISDVLSAQDAILETLKATREGIYCNTKMACCAPNRDHKQFLKPARIQTGRRRLIATLPDWQHNKRSGGRRVQ